MITVKVARANAIAYNKRERERRLRLFSQAVKDIGDLIENESKSGHVSCDFNFAEYKDAGIPELAIHITHFGYKVSVDNRSMILHILWE